ncbi:DUF2279 domain-containing protein [Paracnuella aquatica]|nr:DUF2279 domain-containing protein [Paracnuella aquatica]
MLLTFAAVKKLGCLLLCLAWLQIWAQDTLLPNAAQHSTDALSSPIKCPVGIPKSRQLWVGVASAGFAVGSLVLLNEAWYKQYPRTHFQTFDDSREWLQLDKAGHLWTAYQVARGTSRLWHWAGVPNKKAVLLGSASSLGYMTIIEYLDARSQKWGWSWADVGANTAGTLIFAAQQLTWQEQKLQIKFSAAPRRYTGMLEARADNLFGPSVPERLLKDYNTQTYWLSANLSAITKSTALPSWLNIAFGYGASGLWGGFENKAADAQGNVIFNRPDIRRQRQWYLAPDIDFTRIKTNRRGVKTLLTALNCLKFPAPGLEWTGGKLKGRWIAY